MQDSIIFGKFSQKLQVYTTLCKISKFGQVQAGFAGFDKSVQNLHFLASSDKFVQDLQVLSSLCRICKF